MTVPIYHSLVLLEPPADRPYVLLNMVMSADGKATNGEDERGIGSPTDQRLMREIRTNADMILNGASTLRISGSSPRLGDMDLEQLRIDRGKPRLPTSSILSHSGNLPLDRIFFTADDFDAIVYLSHDAPQGAMDAIVSTGRSAVRLPRVRPLPWMLAHMRFELGAEVLLLEGGPSLNAQMFALNVIDEYFVTIGPVIVGGATTITPVEGEQPFPRDALPRFELLSANPNPDTSEVYLRYRRARS